MFDDSRFLYYRTTENQLTVPNVRVPRHVGGSDAAFAVSRDRVIPIAIAVRGETGKDQELSLSFVSRGKKLKAKQDWTLKGKEVRTEEETNVIFLCIF